MDMFGTVSTPCTCVDDGPLRIPRTLDSDSSASRSRIPRRRSASERSDAVKRLLSVSQTCRLQSRSLFAYLSDVLDARPHEHPAALLT